MDAKVIMSALQDPFPLEDIEWRVQRTTKTRSGVFKAIVVPYVSNRAIQKRLDELFTPFGWKNEFREWRSKGVVCGISIKWGDEWITKYDGADETDIESTKGGFSASQKRAAVEWGIGRYLYGIDEFWVEIKSQGDMYINAKVKIDKNKEEWVSGYWNIPTLPASALPSGYKQNSQLRGQGSNPSPPHVQSRADTTPATNNKPQQDQSTVNPISDGQIKAIFGTGGRKSLTEEQTRAVVKYSAKKDSVKTLTFEEAKDVISLLNSMNKEELLALIGFAKSGPDQFLPGEERTA